MDGSQNKETAGKEASAEKSDRPEIEFNESGGVVSYKNLDLNAKNSTTPEVTITVNKHPLALLEGESYGGFAVLIDKATEKMSTLAKQAESLKSRSEIQRPRAVLELLRSNLHFAYNDVIEEVSKNNPDLANWVAVNTGLNSNPSNSIPLSELFEHGYGVCRHLAVAYLWLAQKVDLEGTLMSSTYLGIKNIKRTDTGDKLFKSVEIGQPAPPHAWVEIKTKGGHWMPVDPSLKLIGDNDESMTMFKKAGYVGWYGLQLEGEPRELTPHSSGLFIPFSEPTAEAKLSLLLRSTLPTWSVHLEKIPPTNTPYSGDGRLNIKTQQNGIVNLSIVSIK